MLLNVWSTVRFSPRIDKKLKIHQNNILIESKQFFVNKNARKLKMVNDQKMKIDFHLLPIFDGDHRSIFRENRPSTKHSVTYKHKFNATLFVHFKYIDKKNSVYKVMCAHSHLSCNLNKLTLLFE